MLLAIQDIRFAGEVFARLVVLAWVVLGALGLVPALFPGAGIAEPLNRDRAIVRRSRADGFPSRHPVHGKQ